MGKILESMPLLYYDVMAIVVYFFIYQLFKRKSDKTRMTVLYLLCVVDFLALIVNDYYFYIRGDSLLTMFPLQLCNIAVFLIPLALLLKKRVLYDFIFYVCALGAFVALIIPSSDYIGQTYSLMTISFFVFHSIIVAIPFFLTGWGFYKPVPTLKSVAVLSLSVFIIAFFMNILNIALGKWFGVEANYFFTIIKYSAPRNPAFELFSRIIPYDMLYLLPALPILWIYVLFISILWRISARKR